MNNPLLDLEGLPPFSRIKPEHVVPAVDQLLGDARKRVDELLASDNRRKRVERSKRRIRTVCADCFLFLKGCSGVYVSHAQPAKYLEYEENMSCFAGYVAAMMTGDQRFRTRDNGWTCQRKEEL